MPDLKINTHSERDAVKRYVVGLDENGKSALLMDGVPNQQERTRLFGAPRSSQCVPRRVE
jgi:hypothetical protein